MNEDCFHLGVKALIVNPKEMVLLLKREHPAKGVYWDIPGGRIQKGESQIDTLLREVKEETGLHNICDPQPLMMSLTDIRIQTPQGDVGLIFSTYLVNISQTFDPVLSHEHIGFEWCTFQNAAEKLKHQYPGDLIENLLKREMSRLQNVTD